MNRMKGFKWRIALVLHVLAAMWIVPAAYAHTGLESASPEAGETAAAEVTELKLSFQTTIEPVSELTLTNEAGEEIPVEVDAGEKTMTGKLAQPLTNGAYTVVWQIVGADGHAVKGSYSFTVELPETPAAEARNAETRPVENAGTDGQTETSPEENAGADGQAEPQPVNEPASFNESTPQEPAAAEPAGGSSLTGLMPVLVIAFCLILFGFMVRGVRK